MSASQVKRPSDDAFFREKREFKRRDAKGWPVGPRTVRRTKENAELNKLPDSVRNFCEIRLPGCLRDKLLQWCHATKSRFLLTSKDWQTACRGCAYCHQTIEAMSHVDMKRIVTDAIKRRSKVLTKE